MRHIETFPFISSRAYGAQLMLVPSDSGAALRKGRTTSATKNVREKFTTRLAQ